MDRTYTDKGKKPSAKGNKPLQLKVCGMNSNTSEVALLKPDYLGFIFWEPSKRYFKGNMPVIPYDIKKVGVFVNATLSEIKRLVTEFKLSYVQLHGKESAAFCAELKKLLPELQIIKVFSINPDSYRDDFKQLEHFEEVCDFYLFDTKGELPGGNGYTFDWSVLKNYPSTKPYFLSGGIGLNEIESIKEFLKTPEAQYCHAIDVNSKFEVEPGLKNIEKLKEFKKSLIKNG